MDNINKILKQIKNNLTAVASVADFYDSLLDRRLVNDKEVEDVKLKMKYAKEQMLGHLLKNKKLLVSLEKKESPMR